MSRPGSLAVTTITKGEIMNVYDIIRRGRWIRQITEHSQRAAQKWADEYFPGSSAVFSHRIAE